MKTAMNPIRCLIQDESTGAWLEFEQPVEIVVAEGLTEVEPALARVAERIRTRALWAAGWVSYEAAPAFDAALRVRPPSDFPLVWFGLFPAPRIVPPPGFPVGEEAPIPWQPRIDEADFRAAIARIRRCIQEGETYQVNFTWRLQAPFTGSPRALFERMIAAQKTRLGAWLEVGDWAICSASPELFFRLEGDRLISRPMKGTEPRGGSAAEDRERARQLAASEKNRAENVMIVDMVRNDLGRVCAPGSVEVTRLFEIERYPTLWQMTSTVEGRAVGGLPEIFRALFPPASITGAPKPRTMGIIADLEREPRSIYTGAIGFWAPGPRAQFNVAIRTVLIDRRRQTAEFGVGGGIVWDSTAGGEWAEGWVKARVLTERPSVFDLLETLAWHPDSGVKFLEEHLDRMEESARYFDRPFDRVAVRSLLLAAGSGPDPLRLRLLVDPTGRPTVERVVWKPLPSPYRVALAAGPIRREDRFLYHKTTRRGIYEEALAGRPGFADVLLWNEAGEVTESCIANVMYEWEGAWYTPPVRCGLLPGVARAAWLKAGRLQERPLLRTELRRVGRVELLNSVRLNWPIEIVMSEGMI